MFSSLAMFSSIVLILHDWSSILFASFTLPSNLAFLLHEVVAVMVKQLQDNQPCWCLAWLAEAILLIVHMHLYMPGTGILHLGHSPSSKTAVT